MRGYAEKTTKKRANKSFLAEVLIALVSLRLRVQLRANSHDPPFRSGSRAWRARRSPFPQRLTQRGLGRTLNDASAAAIIEVEPAAPGPLRVPVPAN